MILGKKNYTGTLEYKGIDFFFVFDGAQLSLIPPKEKEDEIRRNWIYAEIKPGVYTLGDPLTTNVPFLCGNCSETGRMMMFLTREDSFIGFNNTTLCIDIVGLIECQTSNRKYCRMILSNDELNYIHPINRAFYQEFDPGDLQKSGVIAIKTREFSEITTEKKRFLFEGKDVIVNFSIGWKCSTSNGNPPILLNSNIIFEFQETDDYWYLFRLWRLAEKLVQFLTFRKNARFQESALQVKFDDEHYRKAADFRLVAPVRSETDSSLEKGRYIALAQLESKEDKLLSLISEDSLYLRHLPGSFKDGKSLDAATFVLTSAAFEWEFGRLYPDGVMKPDRKANAEKRALEEMQIAIDNSTGEVKKILKHCRKMIGFSNLESKIIQAGKDFDSTVGLFGKHLYQLSKEEFSYSAIGKRLANQRNDFAHGNIDKEFNGPAILDLLFLRYLIYAMQMRRVGVSERNIQNAINDLFGLHIEITDKTSIEKAAEQGDLEKGPIERG